MLNRLLGNRSKKPARSVGEDLYAAAAAQARQPAFYTTLGVEDRIDARFELYTLHVLLLVLRLRDEGEQGAVAAQELFDAYVSALDNVLRELGVGDVSMAKKMRKLGEALYGRMTVYETPIRSGDVTALAHGLSRNVFASPEAETAPALARYALAAHARLAAQSFSAILTTPQWPEVSA